MRYSYRKSQVRAAYLFVTPAIIGIVIFTLIPVISALIYSFADYNVLTSPKFIGLKNYFSLLYDKDFKKSLVNTFIYAIGTLPPKIFISLFLATLLNRKIKGISVFRACYYSPEVTSMVAVSIVWLYIYNPQLGLLNLILEKLGLQPQVWLLNPKLALPSLMLMGVWKNLGVNMMIYLAALQDIPSTYIEAAEIDGANRWQIFWKVTWPLLSYATFFVFITNMIGTLQVFDQIYIMTEGGPANATSTIVYYIYLQAFQQFHMGYASAMAFVLAAIIFLLTMISFNSRKETSMI
ncbi:MAG TPA: sugar ABC transporter permease [Methanothermobacter sp.]|nr:sugar ABC transporter permease [Methanothermobacter sp.]